MLLDSEDKTRRDLFDLIQVAYYIIVIFNF